MEKGACGITCAKLREAEILADAGIPDILIANQIVGRHKIKRMAETAKKTSLTVAVDSQSNIEDLSEAMTSAGVTIGMLVEVDIGMGRCGVQPGEDALRLARIVDSLPGLRFEGLQGYEGHCVLLRDSAERLKETKKALTLLTDTKAHIQDNGLHVKIVSGGGTGTYDITGNWPGVDEVQAGSYATMDWYYGDIRPEFRQALSVLATVISRPKPGKAIIDVGTKGIGLEFGNPKIKDSSTAIADNIFEEHCSVTLFDDMLRVGDKIELIPSHGCTTCSLYGNFYVHKDSKIIDIWPIEAQGGGTRRLGEAETR